MRDTLFHIRYSDEIVVATVRPETLLADTAVAVHPDDERYATSVGTTVTLPLVGRELPVIADEYVDREFGTGALKITRATTPTTSRSAASTASRRSARSARTADDRGGPGGSPG